MSATTPINALAASASAFCPDGVFTLAGAAGGPLSGRRLGVKDVFDMAGHVTGAGNPAWKDSHTPAARHADAVERLLAAGAEVVGKTLTDELAYSLNGENHHYGTPVNPVSPERIPGGSSCGSASAVAAGLCDIGLGTDTAGSIRLPAAYCGLWGFRPTHGAVSSAGVVPLAPSYDTVGWMTRTGSELRDAGEALLPPDRRGQALPERLIIAADAWELTHDNVKEGLRPALGKLMQHFTEVSHERLAAHSLLNWQQAFRTIQGREVWATHGGWVRSHTPEFGPGVRERFEWASTITADTAHEASSERARITAELQAIVATGLICIPTAPFLAPLRASTTSEQDRTSALCLLSIASLAGLPQVTMPAGVVDGCAVGLSLIGPAGSDRALLARACELMAQ